MNDRNSSASIERKRIIATLVIEATLLVTVGIGLGDTVASMISSRSALQLTYFTILSNIFIWFIVAIFMVLNVIHLTRDKDLRTSWLYELKFVFTCGVLLTGLVYNILLARFPLDFSRIDYWTLHTLGPLIALADFVYSDFLFRPSWKHIAMTTSFPLAYAVFAISLSYGGFSWGNGKTVPYPFLDFRKNTWFGYGESLGTFYYIVILSLLFVLAAWLLSYFSGVRRQHIMGKHRD